MDHQVNGFKVVLLGDSAVGKTSLINRWINGTFFNNMHSTVGVQQQSKTIQIGNDSVRLLVWDTAGQELFQSLTPLYVRQSKCAIIVASVTDPCSFDSISFWIKTLNESCDCMPPVILAINKIDLDNEPVFDRSQVEKSANLSLSDVFYVSAATGEGVDNLFLRSGEVALQFNLQEELLSQTTKLDSPKKSCC